ncbi:MAG: hypothetical protein ABIP55_06400, partial [Tepidisphaeraceae bacterium]
PFDLLVAFALNESTGAPESVQINPRAGATGRAVRVLPGGGGVTYVSAGGTPAMSGALPVFDVADIDKIALSYPMKDPVKDMGSCSDIAFHPVLPIAAACAEKGVLLFDLTTAQPLRDRIDFVPNPPTDPKRLIWSPDGRTLLVDVALPSGSRALRAYDLKITQQELTTLRRPRPNR